MPKEIQKHLKTKACYRSLKCEQNILFHPEIIETTHFGYHVSILSLVFETTLAEFVLNTCRIFHHHHPSIIIIIIIIIIVP